MTDKTATLDSARIPVTRPQCRTEETGPLVALPARTAATLLTAFALFSFFAASFLLLRSNQLTEVDGAVRCLDVFHHRVLMFHANNHLLYPVNILGWSKLVAIFGVAAATPDDFIRMSQSMNSIAAAVTLVLMWLLLRRIVRSDLIALGLLAVYAFSRAFLLHATNSAEPVVGLMYSMASLYLLTEGLLRSRIWLVSAAGWLLALALASYQAMFLSVGLCAVSCFLVGWTKETGSLFFRARFLLVFGFSCVVGVALCFGWAYSMQGLRFGPDMVRQFVLIKELSQGYGRFSVSKAANFPIGFLNNLTKVVPDGYEGLRWLVASHSRAAFGKLAGMAFLVLVPLIVLAKAAMAQFRKRSVDQKRSWLLVLAGGAPLFWPLLYWDPLYDKLWLLPLAVLILGIAFIARVDAGQRKRRQVLAAALLVFLACEVPGNLSRAYADSRSPTPGLQEAKQVMQMITPADSIVLDFDNVSVLYLAFSGNQNIVMLPSLLRADAERAVQTQLTRCRERHGRLYFLGILDKPEQEWKMFLEARLGTPYASFDRFRSHSRAVEHFLINNHPLTLRVYEE